jgi:NTE family protein
LSIKKLIFIFTIALISQSLLAQKVGVVLSGGGATGLAHVGLLKALEESNIPIDYITGTSAGALVGAMYASGISPDQIEKYVLSEEFQRMSAGEVPVEKGYLYRESFDNASMLNVPFSLDSSFRKTLPTNFMTPLYLDYEMFRILGVTSINVGNDFDSLFIPFRCVASDITKKEATVFQNGALNKAVRASMTYPFYVNPIRINNTLYFDGGLYNNFPADVLFENFDVDYIIGSNVSYNSPPPTEDDLISQITNMLVVPTDYDLPCESGIIITPQTDVGTFDFSRAKEAIDAGYKHGMEAIDSIRQYVSREITQSQINAKRVNFGNKQSSIKITEIEASLLGRKKKTTQFIERSMIKDSLVEPIGWGEFSKRYFQLYSHPQVKYIYPSLKESELYDSSQKLELEVTPQKHFLLNVGGHFSSRPVNTGYLGLTYLGIADAAVQINAESYFGKFYGSTSIKANFDIPTKVPIQISPYFTLNRWDYFRSFSTFFEDVQPSFLVQNEAYFGAKFRIPLGNKYGLTFDFKDFELRDEYYQNLNFTNIDTADVTNFSGQAFSLNFEKNSLNKKQWANEGSLVRAKFRFVQGKEQSVSGSTSPIDYDVRRRHQWINLTAEGQHFFNSSRTFKLGVHAKGVFNSQSLFANYTASILTMTEFSPIPDAYSFFLEEYRAPQYAGIGINLINTFYDVIDFRLDPYFFQPFRRIENSPNGIFGYSNSFEIGTIMASASLIYHSPIGPLRLTTNYFPKQDNPFVLQLSFGFMIFNERAIR